MKDVFIKKYWDEEDVMYYLHFQGEDAVRQIEIERDKKIFLDREHPDFGEYGLTDAYLSQLTLDKEDVISREEFETAWADRCNVTYIEWGDIFALQEVTSYAHGCNCVGAMGKGIALQFKERFPVMYKQYKQLCKDGGFGLGGFFAYAYDAGVIYNLATQEDWRTQADLNAIRQSLIGMLKHASCHRVEKIAMPKIGAGLGGLKWEDVKRVINQTSALYPMVKLIVVENYVPQSSSDGKC